MQKSIKLKTINGVLWSSIDRFSVQGIQFVIMIIMARMLAPADYGLIGMLAVFIAISNSIVDSGFSNALIRKIDRTNIDYSTVFYFNIGIGFILYLILFLAAPYIASFYNSPLLTSITRVIALSLIINSMSVVQRAIFTITINFKTQFKASFAAVIISGITGIILAFKGFGVWALVIQTVLNGFLNMILLWIFSKWRPLLVFSKTSFNELFSFGSKLLISSIIDTVYKNLYTIVIGKKFAATDLGYYTRADQFVQLPSSNITSILQRVTFPILSELQEDHNKLKSAYSKLLTLSAYLIFPLMMGLAALAYPVVLFFLTEKWIFSADLIFILSFSVMWYPIHAINLNLLQVKGKSDLFLRLEIIKKIIGISILIITIPIGIKAMCIGSVVSSLLSLAINTFYTGKLIDYGFFKQMKDLLPSLSYSFSMGLLIYIIISFIDTIFLKLLVGLIVGSIYYFVISYITKSKDLNELLIIIRSKAKKK